MEMIEIEYKMFHERMYVMVDLLNGGSISLCINLTWLHSFDSWPIKIIQNEE